MQSYACAYVPVEHFFSVLKENNTIAISNACSYRIINYSSSAIINQPSLLPISQPLFPPVFRKLHATNFILKYKNVKLWQYNNIKVGSVIYILKNLCCASLGIIIKYNPKQSANDQHHFCNGPTLFSDGKTGKIVNYSLLPTM